MRTISILMLLAFLTSCGGDNSTTGDEGMFGPFTSSHANKFIQEIKQKSPAYRPGQMKMVYQSKEKEISKDIVCDYWDDRTISVTKVNQNTITLETKSKTSLMNNEPTSCPQRLSEDSTNSKQFLITEYEKITTEFIRYHIDHQYRCTQNPSCETSRFIKSEDTELKGVAAKLITTEYTYKNGDVGILNTWVSKNSLFEGVLAYKMVDKTTEKWWLRRGFISSYY